MQLSQVVMCAAVAAAASTDRAAVFFVWLAFIAAALHVANALMMLEMDRMGDCRTCCNPVGQCHCGRRRDPLPAGTLTRMACLVQRRWRRRRRSRSRSRENTSPPAPPH